MILILVLFRILYLNAYSCQTSANDSLLRPQTLPQTLRNPSLLSNLQILSNSLGNNLNLSRINQLILSGENVTEASTGSTSPEPTTLVGPILSSSTALVSTTTMQTTIVSTQSMTTISITNGTSTNPGTTTPQSGGIVLPSTGPPVATVTMTTISTETTITTISTTTTAISTSPTMQSNTSNAAPIVLSTEETTGSEETTGPEESSMSTTNIYPGLSTNSGNIGVSTLKNLYPQDLRYSCPKAPNGCKGPKDCLYKHPDCTMFFHCNDAGQAFPMACPLGTEWNDEEKICDLPQNANCTPSTSP